MASRNFLIEGLDLTGLPGDASNAEILQSIRESIPAIPDLGWHIRAEDTPDVAAHAEYETFLWTKISTGETKYWNGTSWQLIKAQATIADGSISIAKLNADGGVVGDILQVNGSNGFNFTTISAAITNNSIALNKLVNAPDEGYILFSDTGGVWTYVFWNTQFELSLSTAPIPIANLTDLDGSGTPGQVLSLAADESSIEFAWADQTLRANQVTTNRLKFASGNAGKFVKVNALSTDFDYVSTSLTLSAAVVKYSVATNGAAQAIPATTETTVQFNTEVDPDNIVTLTSNQVVLTTGTYLIDVSIPIRFTAGTATKVYIALLYDVTGTSVLATNSLSLDNDDDVGMLHLKHTVKIAAASNTYDIRIYSDKVADLGGPANLSTYAETYQQMSILKVA